MSSSFPAMVCAVLAPPIRNGDAANLALTLLGLPMVAASYFKPELLNPEETSLLTIGLGMGGGYTVKWPLSATSYRLEKTSNLTTGPWSAITTGLMTTATDQVCTFTPTSSKAFFRLQKI
jgi:hypothetical protein